MPQTKISKKKAIAPNHRVCLSCRQVKAKECFWRIVRVHPSHQVQLDEGMGRSAYLCPNESCLKIALQKNRLARALKTSVPESTYQLLWERLQKNSQEI